MISLAGTNATATNKCKPQQIQATPLPEKVKPCCPIFQESKALQPNFLTLFISRDLLFIYISLHVLSIKEKTIATHILIPAAEAIRAATQRRALRAYRPQVVVDTFPATVTSNMPTHAMAHIGARRNSTGKHFPAKASLDPLLRRQNLENQSRMLEGASSCLRVLNCNHLT